MSLLCVLVTLSLVVGTAPNDSDFDLQWALHNTGQVVNGSAGVAGADIAAVAAWDRHGGARPVVVAIIGGGVDAHEEFADRLLPGYVTSLAGGDPYSTLDIGQNGTRAAGVIAAKRGNGLGIAGINDRVLVLPIRVAAGLPVSAESVAEGLIWAADQRVDIALVLVQFYAFNQALADAASHASKQGVLVIAPAGHDGSNTVAFPAVLDECIAVSATTSRDEIASFSNYGPEVDISAPGEWIWSTLGDDAYGYGGIGNSFLAAAHVAGVASLLRSYSPGLPASAIRQILLATADDLGEPGFDDHFGAGRINALSALLAATAPLLRFEPVTPIPVTVPPLQAVSFPVRIVNGTGTLNPTSPELVYRSAPGPFTGAIPMQPMGGNLYSASFPAMDCGASLEFYLLAGALSGLTVTDPPQAPTKLHQVTVDPDVVLFHDDFEDDLGWKVSTTGTSDTGVWVRQDPVGTMSGTTAVQPEYDRSEDGKTLCYFTGQHQPGASIGSNDVDLGPVILTSPVIDIAQHHDVEVRFASWLYSSQGTLDPLIMEFSRDAGATWIVGAVITPTQGWEFKSVILAAFPGVTGSQLRVRFTISDNPPDSLTEAAVDEFSVVAKSCDSVPGDANGDGLVNLHDMGILGDCMTGPLTPRSANCAPIDANGDLRVDLRDAAILLRGFRPTH